ncbi:Erv1/Alr family FAD-linked sulfhydryl oxidase [Salipiger aestuarii]|uniref:ERV1/ALR-related protein n=1 Tax=Salipiger aestuarii TaxID=568098 RepID=UPI00123C6921|nr:ERV1/ALR-related protein [Salipiger aestuarii]
MARMHDYDQIGALWNDWQGAIATRPADPPETILSDVLRTHGTLVSSQEVSFALAGADREASRSAARFTDCMVALLGDPALRLRHAFAAFDADADQTIAKTDLLTVTGAFADTPEEAGLLADEIDADGDGRISLADLVQYLDGAPPPVAQTYRATHVPDHHLGAFPGMPAPSTATAKPHPDHDADAGISPLHLRIGFFRLMQGAAYRSFRENYSANSETHIRARDLPYTIEDFARFTTVTIDYYLALGLITDAACIAEFRRLDEIVQAELDRLHTRVRTWPTIPRTPGMLAAQAKIADERDGLSRRQHLCRAVMELVLSLRLHGLRVDRSGVDALAGHEINRLRHQDLRAETHRNASIPRPWDADTDYRDSWNRVILSDADARIDGAIMPTRFWYDEFMPQLLLCASLITADDLRHARGTTEQDLDTWHAELRAQGAFDRFATDLRDGFAACSFGVKRMLKQAWVLTAPYLTGIEKRRERAEFGRDSGFLSEYVAFIDVHLGRNDVATADMRLSFPYYIGPAVWAFLHGSAELIETMPDAVRRRGTDRFAAFFRGFATMYPCPYCRYHLNRYVIRNREVDMYPVEFLLLGRQPGRHDTGITLDDKLATITAPGALRVFLWKLHNAVSSSIARTEPWYHRQPKPLYTSRFWPSIEAEMARSAASGHDAVAIAKVTEIYGITKPAAHLAVLRDELTRALRADDKASVAQTIDRAEGAIADLELAIEEASFLTRKYAYDPAQAGLPPTFDAIQETFARSGVFVER